MLREYVDFLLDVVFNVLRSLFFISLLGILCLPMLYYFGMAAFVGSMFFVLLVIIPLIGMCIERR